MKLDPLLQLLEERRFDDLESRWLAAVEKADARATDGLLEIIRQVLQADQPDRAEMLAWTWLSDYRSRATPAEAFKLARALLLLLPDSQQLRSDAAELYRQLWPERAEVLLAASGLEQGQPVQRAIRVLDACSCLQPGCFVVECTDNQAFQVLGLDMDRGVFMLAGPVGQREVPARDLAYHYQPAEPDDFRVLQQFRPEAIPGLIESDPLRLVLGIIHSRGGQIDSDKLRYTLTPRYLPPEKWSKWWSRLRPALAACPHVRMEGRSPVRLIYHEHAATAQDQALRDFDRADRPAAQWQVIRRYVRQAGRGGSQQDHHALLRRLAERLARQLQSHQADRPVEAFVTTVMLAWLREQVGEALGPIATPAVGRMLQQSAQPAQALATLPDVQLWQTAVDAIRRELPADWPQIYLTALSVAPPQVCDMLAAALLSDNRAAQLQSAIEAAMARPAEHVGSLIWLWHGPQLTRPLALPSRIELLLRMLSALDELAEVPPAQRALAQAARSRIRSAILAEKGGLLRRCLERLDDLSLAAALRRQVQRCGGLSAAARQDMLEAIQQAFPRLFVRSSDQPWDQPDVLYVTAQSWSRKEQELRQLVEVKLRDNARAIGEAAARGDLSENSEYKFALEERDLLRARIGRIQSQMAIARIITPADVPTDQVGVGSRVTLRNDQTNQTLEITILGPWEADIERGIYNYQAPAARRLLGLRPGQTVSLPIGGHEVQYRIERVAVALE